MTSQSEAACRALAKFAVGALLALGLGACDTPKVVKYATPNTLAGQGQFAVEHVHLVDLQVDGMPEKEFLAPKPAETLARWEETKKAVDQTYLKTLKMKLSEAGITAVDAPQAGAQLTIRPTIHWIESGYYRIPAWNAVTKIKMSVEIVDERGVTQDEILVESSEPFDAVLAASVGPRMIAVAETLAEKTAKYVIKRTGK